MHSYTGWQFLRGYLTDYCMPVSVRRRQLSVPRVRHVWKPLFFLSSDQQSNTARWFVRSSWWQRTFFGWTWEHRFTGRHRVSTQRRCWCYRALHINIYLLIYLLGKWSRSMRYRVVFWRESRAAARTRQESAVRVGYTARWVQWSRRLECVPWRCRRSGRDMAQDSTDKSALSSYQESTTASTHCSVCRRSCQSAHSSQPASRCAEFAVKRRPSVTARYFTGPTF